MKSQSKYKDIRLGKVSLQLNPEISDSVEILDSLGCNFDGVDGEDEDVVIEPGETYEVLFKLDVGQINLAQSMMEDDDDSESQSRSDKAKKDPDESN